MSDVSAPDAVPPGHARAIGADGQEFEPPMPGAEQEHEQDAEDRAARSARTEQLPSMEDVVRRGAAVKAGEPQEFQQERQAIIAGGDPDAIDEGKEDELDEELANSMLEFMLHNAPPQILEERWMVKRHKRWVRLRSLLEGEIDELNRRVQRRPTKEERERGAIGATRDNQMFNRLVVIHGMKEPKLDSPQMIEAVERGWQRQGRHEKATPDDVLRVWFLPGEVLQLSEKVLELSGWTDDALERAGK